MEALRLEKSHSLECANDLLDLPQERPSQQHVAKSAVARHSLTYSIDEARPKTRDDFTELQNALIEKIQSFRDNSMYELFLEGCIRNLGGLLELDQLRKMTGEMQTMLNQKIAASKVTVQSTSASSANKKGQKPCNFCIFI